MTEKTSVGADKRQTIDAYAAAGFRLTPLRTTDPHRGKAPQEKNWTDTPYEPNPKHEIFKDCNFGVVLDDCHVVIDIDPRNYPEGRKVWTELSTALGLSPDLIKSTFVVATGGGGNHIYFKKPADLAIRHTHPDYPGLEFKTKGRQVVGATGIHPDTNKAYKILSGTPSGIQDAPESLLNLIKQEPMDMLPALVTFDATKTDTPQATERFLEHLDLLDPVDTGSRNNACFIAACRAKELGVGETNAFHIISQSMKYKEPLADDEMRKAVRSAYANKKVVAGSNSAEMMFTKLPKPLDKSKLAWDLDGKGKAKATLGNLCRFLSLDELGLTGLLAYNELSNAVETTRPVPWPPYTKKVWDDGDHIHLKHYISRLRRVEYTKAVISEAVLAVSMYQSFHPVRNWLDRLVWDKTPRLDTWMHRIMGVVDNPYTRAAGAITIMASVKRMYQPGAKFDYMLILEGPQGIKKTQVIETLAGNDPELFCSTSLNLDNSTAEKDTVANIATAMFVELAELVVRSDSEEEQVKAFLTRRYDKVRLPYKALPVNLPRQCVFIGTTNPEKGAGYFKGRDENRRFWPVECLQTADLLTLELERDQLFAEAKERVLAGEKIFMDEDVEALAKVEQAERKMVDPWQDLIEEYIDRNQVWLVEDVYKVVLKCDPRYFGPREQRRVAAAMRNAGFQYDKYYHAGSGKRRRAFKHPSYDIACEHDKALEAEEKILDNEKE